MTCCACLWVQSNLFGWHVFRRRVTSCPKMSFLLLLCIQSVSVQRGKHDGPLQLGYLFWSHPDVCPWGPWSGVLPGARQRTHQDHHHPPRHHISGATRPAGPHLHHPWNGRGLLVRMFTEGFEKGREALSKPVCFFWATRISLPSIKQGIKAPPEHSMNRPMTN